MAREKTIVRQVKDEIIRFTQWATETKGTDANRIDMRTLRDIHSTIFTLWLMDVINQTDYEKLGDFFYKTVTDAGFSFVDCIHNVGE